METFGLGTNVVVVKGSEKENTQVLEGVTCEVVKVMNTVLTIRGRVGHDTITTNVLADGRNGTDLVPYSRAHRAAEVKAEAKFKAAEAEKEAKELAEDQVRLGFESDSAYEADKNKKVITSIINEVLAGKK